VNIYRLYVSLTHDVCWTPLTEYFSDHDLHFNTRTVNCLPNEDKVFASGILRVVDDSCINEFAKMFKSSYPSKRAIRHMIRIGKKGLYYVDFEAEYDLSISSIIYELNVPAWSEHVENGNEIRHFIIFTKSRLKELLDRLRLVAKINNLYLKRIGWKEFGSIVNDPLGGLTQRQRKIITVAFGKGYYDWPRQISLSELSEILNCSKVSALKELRASEKKIIRKIMAEYSLS